MQRVTNINLSLLYCNQKGSCYKTHNCDLDILIDSAHVTETNGKIKIDVTIPEGKNFHGFEIRSQKFTYPATEINLKLDNKEYFEDSKIKTFLGVSGPKTTFKHFIMNPISIRSVSFVLTSEHYQ